MTHTTRNSLQYSKLSWSGNITLRDPQSWNRCSLVFMRFRPCIKVISVGELNFGIWNNFSGLLLAFPRPLVLLCMPRVFIFVWYRLPVMSFSFSGCIIIISTSEGTQPAMVVALPEFFNFPVARAETEVTELALEDIAK